MLKYIGCNSSWLAGELAHYCHLDRHLPLPGCCGTVLMTVDTSRFCLCQVVEQGELQVSDLDVHVIWYLYKRCGGRRQVIPKDTGTCVHGPPPPPPPPPPPKLPSPPPPLPKLSTPPPSLPDMDNALSPRIVAWVAAGSSMLVAVVSLATMLIVREQIKSAESRTLTNFFFCTNT